MAAIRELKANTRYIAIVEDRMARVEVEQAANRIDLVDKREQQGEITDALILLGFTLDEVERLVEQTLAEFENEERRR